MRFGALLLLLLLLLLNIFIFSLTLLLFCLFSARCVLAECAETLGGCSKEEEVEVEWLYWEEAKEYFVLIVLLVEYEESSQEHPEDGVLDADSVVVVVVADALLLLLLPSAVAQAVFEESRLLFVVRGVGVVVALTMMIVGELNFVKLSAIEASLLLLIDVSVRLCFWSWTGRMHR